MAQKVEFILDIDSRRIASGSRKAERSVKGVDRAVDSTRRNTSRLSKVWKKFGGLVSALAIGAVVARGFRQMIKVGKEFEQQLADLSAITGISGEDLDSLGERAVETSNRFGESSANIIEAQKLVASQLAEKIDFGTEEGLEQLKDISDQAVLLQKAAGVDLNTAVQAVSTSLNQFGLEASQAAKVVDTLAAGSKFGAAEVTDQAEAIRVAGVSASSANVSFQELTAGIQILAQNGIKAQLAGTGLRNVMVRLQTQSSKLAEQGLTDIDLKADGFAQTLEKLQPIARDTEALTEIFGERAQAVASILIQSASSVEEMTAKVNQNGIANEQAEVQLDTFAGAANRLTAVFNNQLIGAFTETNGVMVAFLDITTQMIQDAGLLVSGLNDVTKEVRELGEAGASSGEKIDNAFVRILQKMGLAVKTATTEIIDAQQEERDSLEAQINAYDDNVDALEKIRRSHEGRRKALKEAMKDVERGSEQELKFSLALNDTEELLDRVNRLLDGHAQGQTALAGETQKAREEQERFNESVKETEELFARLMLAMNMGKSLREFMADIGFSEQGVEPETGVSGDPSAPEPQSAQGGGFERGDVVSDKMAKEMEYTELVKNLSKERRRALEAESEHERALHEANAERLQDEIEAEQEVANVAQMATRMRIQSLADLGNMLREQIKQNIKARLAEAVAIQIQKVLGSIPFPFNLLAAGGAALAVNKLFDKLVPEFLTGGLVGGQTGMGGLTSGGRKLISMNEDGRSEFIVNAESTRRNLGLLEAINNDPDFGRNRQRQVVAGGSGELKIDTNAIMQAVREGASQARVVAVVEVSELDEKLADYDSFQKTIGNR